MLVEYWTDIVTQCCSQSLCGNIGQSWHNIALARLNAMHDSKKYFLYLTHFSVSVAVLTNYKIPYDIQFHFTRKTVWPKLPNVKMTQYAMFKGNVMFRTSSIHF